MPLFLSKRNTGLIEWMDRNDCDKELLYNTYSQFDRINRLLSGWTGLYRRYIKPLILDAGSHFSILDIGCGGGDIIRHLHRLCLEDDLDVEFTGIEPDGRAIEFLDLSEWPANIKFRKAHSSELVETGESYDLVISNHLMHHLTAAGLFELCSDAERLASKRVLFNDIERSDIGYLSFMIAAPLLFRNSYIVIDGLTSIRRSYRKQELAHVLSPRWQVKRKMPFRLIALYDQI